MSAMRRFLCVVAAGVLAGAAAPPPGDAIRVKGIGGDTVVQLLPSEGGGRVRLDVMARLLGGRLDTLGAEQWRLVISGTGFDIHAGIPFAAYNGFSLPLLEAPIVAEGAPHVPLQLFSEIIPRFGIGILWDRTRWEVRLFQAIARREPAIPSSSGALLVSTTAATTGASAAVPASSAPVASSVVMTPPQPAATPALAAPTPTPASATASAESTATPAVTPTQPAPAASVSTAPPAPGPPARAANAPPGLSRKYTIAVDAGHGGVDPGNPGVILNGRRVNESRLTLAMAKRLESELRSRGLDVVMTREEDRLIALEERGPLANSKRADLFISLHTNAANPNWRNGSAVRGVETYFLATARTEDERRVAAMENEVVRFEVETNPRAGDPLGFILNDIAQNEHLRESADLAQLVQAALAAKHPGPNRGVKQAGFMVLSKAFMPAVLVEVGFGTNAQDAAWMNSVAGQREIAESISDAVMEYLRHYERRTRAPGR